MTLYYMNHVIHHIETPPGLTPPRLLAGGWAREIVNSTVTIWSTPRLPYGVLHMAHIYNIMEYSTGWRYGVLHMVINSGIMEYSTDGNMEYSISYVNETSWST